MSEATAHDTAAVQASAAEPARTGPGPLECVLIVLASVGAFFFWWVLVNPLGSQLLDLITAMLAGRGAIALLAVGGGPATWRERLALRLPPRRAWGAALLLAPAALLTLEIQNALFAAAGFEPLRGALEVAPVALGLDKPSWLPGALLAIVIVSPLCSELLFRGVVQPGLVGRFGRWKGLLAAALLASGAHVAVVAFGSPAGGLVALAVFAWNLLLGWVREVTGSTLASAAVRAFANLQLVVAFALAAKLPVPGLTAQGTHLPAAVLVVAALATAAGIALLRPGKPAAD